METSAGRIFGLGTGHCGRLDIAQYASRCRLNPTTSVIPNVFASQPCLSSSRTQYLWDFEKNGTYARSMFTSDCESRVITITNRPNHELKLTAQPNFPPRKRRNPRHAPIAPLNHTSPLHNDKQTTLHSLDSAGNKTNAAPSLAERRGEEPKQG